MKTLQSVLLCISLLFAGSMQAMAAEVNSISALKNSSSNSDLVIKDGYKVQILINNGYDLYLWDGEAGVYLMYGATGNLNKPSGTVITGGTIKCYYYGTEGFECGSISNITTTEKQDFFAPKDYEPYQIDISNFGDYMRVKGEFSKVTNDWGMTEYVVKDEYAQLVVTNDLVSSINLEDYLGKSGFFTLLYAFNSASGQSLMPINANFFSEDDGGMTTVEAPQFSINGGTVEKGTQIEIIQPNAAMIIYTTDGTTPSFEENNGQVYDAPIFITHDMTIKAIAVDDDGHESDVAEATFTVYQAQGTIEVEVWKEDFQTAETSDYIQEVVNPNATYSMQEVKNIWYTEVRNTNKAGGEAPELFMPRSTIDEHFIAEINLNGVYGYMTLTFKSTDDEDNPTVTITSTTTGTTISNITNTGCDINVPEGTETLTLVFGNTKTTTGGLYFDDFLLKGTKVISDEPIEVDAPTFTPDGGEVAKGTAVTITQDAAAMILYTLDGTEPSYELDNGEVYSSPIIVNNDVTIKAIALDDKANPSPIATAVFTVIDEDMVTIWSENWDNAAGATTDLWPSEVTNANAVYSMNKEQPVYIGTKQTNRAGGNVPELALPKQSRDEQWIATIDLKGISGEMNLTYKVNNVDGLQITTTTDGVQLGSVSANGCKLTVAEGTEYLQLIFGNTSDEYVYIDDIALRTKRPEPKDFTLNIGETGYATLYYANYDIELPADENLEANSYYLTSDGEFTVLHNFGKTIYAGYPVVIEGAVGTYTIKATYSSDDDTKPNIAMSNVLFGTNKDEMTKGNGLFYKFEEHDGKGCFYLSETSPEPGKAFNNSAHTAYLCVPAELQGTNLVTAYMIDGSQTTEIKGVDALNGSSNTTRDNQHIYTLSGQKVAKQSAKSGIYIVDNKKVVIK